MKRLKTFLITFIGRLFRVRQEEKGSMWLEVPLSCNTAEDKSEVIFSALNLMEQLIIVKNK
jgi:hypothetical protein